jgi:hypothetical protein
VRRGKKKKGEKGWGLLVGLFHIILNVEVGRHYIITWLLSPVGKGEEPLSQEEVQFHTIPNLACLSVTQNL